MGVTIKSKNLSADMGYMGFNRFRQKVAELSNSEFGKHLKLQTFVISLIVKVQLTKIKQNRFIRR